VPSYDLIAAIIVKMNPRIATIGIRTKPTSTNISRELTIPYIAYEIRKLKYSLP
jgi:hypothetical protein